MILNNMKHFINLKDIKTKDLRNIILDAKKRKKLRNKLKNPPTPSSKVLLRV